MSAFLDALAGPWLDLLLVGSLQFAVVVAVAVALDRTALRGAAPRTRLALWMAVLIPLAIPLRPRVATVDLALVTPKEQPTPTVPGVDRHGEVEAVPPAPVEYRPAERRSEPPRALDREDGPASRVAPAAAPTARPGGSADANPTASRPNSTVEPGQAADPGPGPAFPWRPALALAWLIGAAAMLFRAARAEARFRRLLATSPPGGERIRRLTADAARIAGLATPPRIARCDALPSPAVHGLLRPRIAVPDVSALTDEELLAVLVHECFHVRRRDLSWLPLVVLLRAVWWFHPLVHHAAGTLADALEEARDRNALDALERAAGALPASPSPARLAYARVLVQLAEGRARPQGPSPEPPALAPGAIPLTRDGRGLRRRVAMIVSHPSPHRFAAVGGAALAAAVLGLGLVGAGAAPPADQDPRPSTVRVSPGGVHVERQSPLPEWRKDLDAQLARRLPGVTFVGVELSKAFRSAADEFDLPLVVDEDALYDEGDPTVDVRLSNVSGAEILDVLCTSMDDFAWSVTSRRIHVGPADELPYEIDLRFYRVRPILEARGIQDADDLMSFVLEFGSAAHTGHRFPDTWDMDGWSIDLWRGLLAVRATEDTHRSIHAVLERLLVAQERPTPAEEPWRAPLEAALEARIDVDWEDKECSAALVELSKQVGAPILHPHEHPDDYGNAFSFHLTGARVGDLLDLVAADQERHVQLADGAVLLARERSVETRLHSIGALLELAAGTEEDLIAELDDFTQGIDRESWEEDPRCISFRIGDVLAVRQTAAVHDRISALLAQLERALRAD
ncbi:MAG: M56 family metallopeptidase [Planctomycetota bacterium]